MSTKERFRQENGQPTGVYGSSAAFFQGKHVRNTRNSPPDGEVDAVSFNSAGLGECPSATNFYSSTEFLHDKPISLSQLNLGEEDDEDVLEDMYNEDDQEPLPPSK